MANNKDFVVKGRVDVGGLAKQRVGTSTISTSAATANSIAEAKIDNLPVGNFYGISFNNDGTYVYYTQTSRVVNQYALSTAWDVTTIASTATNTLDVSSVVTSNLYSMCFNSDGTKMYLQDYVTVDVIYQYSLSTAYDISTATYDSKSFNHATQTPSSQAMSLSNDDSTLILADSNNHTEDLYTLSTAGDISTASYTSTMTANTSIWQVVTGCVFNSDGSKLFINARDPSNSIYKIFEFDLSTNYDITTASYVAKSSSADGFTSYGLAIKPDDTALWQSNGVRFNYNIGDTTNIDLDLSTGTIFNPTLEETNTFTVSNPPAEGSQNFKLELDTSLNSAYDLANVSLGPESMDTNLGSELYVRDSSHFYYMTESTASVYYRSMSNFDLSTETPINSALLNDASDAEYRGGITFKPDGTKVFIMGSYYKRLAEFSLSSPWDLSTHTYLGQATHNPSGTNDARGFQFKSDGTRFFILYRTASSTESAVYQFDASTAWGRAGTANGSYSLGAIYGNGLAFNNDGTKMFVITNAEDTYEYALSTAWDVTTASLSATLEDFNGDCIVTADEGKLLFRTKGNVGFAHKFGKSVSGTWPSSFNWQGTQDPELTAQSESFSVVTADGGTTYLAK